MLNSRASDEPVIHSSRRTMMRPDGSEPTRNGGGRLLERMVRHTVTHHVQDDQRVALRAAIPPKACLFQ